MAPTERSPVNRTCKKLALLVGSNPLPNYLAAVILHPSEVVLLYTPETSEPRTYLTEVLQERGIYVTEQCIADASDVHEIRRRCRDMNCDHLHYSGGTKTMAAQARMVFNGSDMQASYLDERKGRLRFDDGWSIDLATTDLGLTVDLVLKLHGIEGVQPSGSVADSPTAGDVQAVLTGVLRDPSIAQKLYDDFRPGGKRRSRTDAMKEPFVPSNYGLALSVAEIPNSGWSNQQYETWEKFITGGWLEQWIAELIHRCLGEASPPIEVNLRCKRKRNGHRTEFEIDIALVRGHRLYVVSCTTAQKKTLCKSKLFEVAMRSRQMGGDLARSALVCLLDGGDSQGPYIEQLRADIASLWDAPNVPRVFGLADLREWAAMDGEPNLETLREWLNS